MNINRGIYGNYSADPLSETSDADLLSEISDPNSLSETSDPNPLCEPSDQDSLSETSYLVPLITKICWITYAI